jgi:hypothetical protein
MADRVLFGSVRSERGAVLVAIREYRGRKYIDIRYHFRDEDGTLRPTKRGATLPFDPLVIAEVMEALRKVVSEACDYFDARMGLRPLSPPVPAEPTPPPKWEDFPFRDEVDGWEESEALDLEETPGAGDKPLRNSP